ncbi:MAG: glycosyltransferase 87 family protein, partial [Candidatus Dormiibacterota bacterium]
MADPVGLVTGRAAIAGLVAVGVAAGFVGVSLATRGSGGFFNDFYDYWGAARLLATGGNPYDSAALAAVVQGAGVQFQVGTGYSYPLLFAILMLPLAALPATTAAYVFTALGLLALALSVTILLAPLSRLRMVELLLLGGYAGLFTSVRGTIYFGQANLLVLPLLAVAFRGRLRAPMLALATAVKLYPVAGLVALAARGR